MRSELMGAFLDEVEELLEQLEHDILQLEQEGDSEQTIQSIFRTAHTLKGSSATMGFEQMKALTHEMENVLDLLRNRRMTVTNETVNVLFECLDMLGVLKLEVERFGNTRSNPNEIVLRLQSLYNDAATSVHPGNEGNDTLIVHPGRDTLKVQDAVAVTGSDSSPQEQVQRRIECHITFTDDCEMKSARALLVYQTLAQNMRVLSTSPTLEEIMNQSESDKVVYFVETDFGTVELEALIRKELEIEDVVLHQIEEAANTAPVSNTRPDISLDKSRATGVKSKEVMGKIAEVDRKSVHTIRVGVDRLDNLMNLVGELVIDQTRIAQLSSVLRDIYHTDEAFEDLEQISNHIARVISELQESVMKTRMLPIERLFDRFPRMVRDLAKELGKEIELVVSGKETDLDRTVIEEIGDPLIHLIRNSVDHGIESREERLAAGKPAKGSIHIRAMHQENHVIITVEDDGSGISPAKIKASAVANGLITEAMAESIGDRQAIQLIFEPGFSTSKKVSEVSGRGVGMDIVRTHIEKLNGLIDVETKPGEGTKFTIKLPLTLAIVSGLLIRLSHITYALPMSSVVEIVRIPQEEIKWVKKRAVVQIREQVMPLIWLHDHFNIPRAKRGNRHVFVVVVGVAEKRLGLVVDELIGNQEIVVKSIGSYIGKVEGVSGATILGDGSVALILDIVGLLKLVSNEKGKVLADAIPMAEE